VATTVSRITETEDPIELSAPTTSWDTRCTLAISPLICPVARAA
jgi:hypothetical protein